MVGLDRAVVSSKAGTTRDAVDTTIKDESLSKWFKLIDTAGIRKRAKVHEKMIFLAAQFNFLLCKGWRKIKQRRI